MVTAPLPPPTAYDTMKRLMPNIGEGVKGIADRFRSKCDPAEYSNVTQGELLAEGGLRFLVERCLLDRWDDGEITQREANMIGSNLAVYINYELHHRKTFWIDAPLAYMLEQTQLDIEGEALKLPFPCSAFVLNDPVSLELGKALLRFDRVDAADALKVMTVYALHTEASGDAHGIEFHVFFDWLDGRLPGCLTRFILIEPRAHLDEILETHFAPSFTVPNRDPIFESQEMKRLLHFLVNAILYTNSADVEIVPIRSRLEPLSNGTGNRPRRARAVERERARRMRQTTAEEVLFLPGKIDIRHRMRPHDVTTPEASDSVAARHLMSRFTVRGHWRRPNPAWKDQRMRWILPYWKGPDIGTVIAREYRMRA